MWGALFPGQGSQSVGMGRFLFEEFQSARELFEQASDTLSQNFKTLCFEGPESDLQLTQNTQPALLLVSVASFRVLGQLVPFAPQMGAGHSIGEYAALVASDVIPFDAALKAVRRRGQEMQQAVPIGEGAMCAVLGLADDVVRKLCELVEKESGFAPLEPANFNTPGQVVVSGSAKGIDWMRNNVKQDWLTEKLGEPAGKPKFIPLAVSAPFHCSMMKPAERAMADVLNAIEFKLPRFHVVQNLTASISSDPAMIRTRLIGQISGAVLWSQCQSQMIQSGVTQYIEFGNGKVLTGLLKKISAEHPSVTLQSFNLNSLEDIKTIEAQFKGGLA